MSGGKGGQTKSEIPRWIAQPAERNIARAEQAGQIGFVPHYGPSVAAFSPMQEQAFSGIGQAAQAFGMAPQGFNTSPQMPAQDFGGGLRGYSSGTLFDQALEELRARRPDQLAAIEAMFSPTGAQQPMPATPAPMPQERRDFMDVRTADDIAALFRAHGERDSGYMPGGMGGNRFSGNQDWNDYRSALDAATRGLL